MTPAVSNNNRIAAVIIETSSSKFLLVNLYLPTDTRYDVQNVSVFNEALLSASSLTKLHGIDFIVYGGDFNTDFRRNVSLHTDALIRFMSDETLVEPNSSID